MTAPAWGTDTDTSSATCGRRPMIANSPVPIPKPPTASATSAAETRARRGSTAEEKASSHMGSLMGNGQCRRALRPEKNLGDMSADVGLDQQGYAAMQYRFFLR